MDRHPITEGKYNMAHAKIYILDDNPLITNDIYHRLETLGYATAKAPVTNNIMETLHEAAIDLVILNIQYSRSPYAEKLAEKIFTQMDAPVIYLIPGDTTRLPAFIANPACFGFIKHPCTNDDLKAVVEIALVRHGQEKRLKDRKKSDQKRKKLEEQLAHAGKMEAIGTLAGGIAHEFNNLMAIITSNTELALDDIHGKDPVYGNLIAIQDACLRARDSVRQILTFSRQAGQELTPMKIAPAIRQSIALIKSSIPRNIKVYEDFGIQSDSVNADPVLIHQVIENLCANAIYAMEEKGGLLTVSLSRTELTDAMGARIIGLIPGTYVKLSITDTGHGMDPETRARIFNPYFTTKEIGKGTGIGLSVVHGIIANHGGAITVSSEPGMGTTFDVFLPVVMLPSIAATNIKKMPTGSEKILIVDDDEPVATAVKMVLKRLGYQIVAMTNPITALNAFRAEPDSFDLVITDLAMPQMTGVALFKHIRNIRHDIPVILCTGFNEKLSEEMANEMGINAFMLKPLVRRQLAETVRTVLDQDMDMEYDEIQFSGREPKVEYGLN